MLTEQQRDKQKKPKDDANNNITELQFSYHPAKPNDYNLQTSLYATQQPFTLQ